MENGAPPGFPRDLNIDIEMVDEAAQNERSRLRRPLQIIADENTIPRQEEPMDTGRPPISQVFPISLPDGTAILQKKKREEPKSSYQTEPEDDPDDIFRARGTLYLEIDHFSDFCKGPPEMQQRLSKSVYVRGIPWKILAIPRTQRNTKALGFFLQCNGEAEASAWSCIAHATLDVVSKKEGIENHSRKISHTFYPKENDWGYSQFLSCDILASPESGYILDDTVTLTVIVTADAPHGVQWDSKKHTGFIGLKNQGATCYMNSILQTLFFTNKLRKAVYQLPTTKEDNVENSVPLAMQRVFYDLSHNEKPVGTKRLTKSFGWDSLDSFLQHDVQELCRVLLDNLETKMKGTPVEDTIPSLFKGKTKSYIKCTEVDFESSHTEVFYDVQLNVRAKDHKSGDNNRTFNIMDSFRDYVEAERMDGDNKYDAGQFGLQPALKGVSFINFPPVLHLQLMRFQFDPTVEANIKVNDRFEFTDVLDLNEFVTDRGDEDYTYVLHAVLVHSGDFHGGHYVVYINTDVKSKVSRWCKFDDDVVSRSTFKDAVAANFGGDDAEVLGRIFTNAYMLVYIRKSCIDDVLCEVMDDDIPLTLRERLEHDRSEEAKKKKEKQEAHLYMDLYVMTNDKMAEHHGFDLFDLRIFDDPTAHQRVEKAMTFEVFYQMIATQYVLPKFKTEQNNLEFAPEFRIWQFVENNVRDDCTHVMSLMRMRASALIALTPENRHKKVEEVIDHERAAIYVEMPIIGPDGVPHLKEYNDKSDILVFLKYFNHKKREIEFVGHIMAHYRNNLESMVPEINALAGLPPNTKLRFYEEISPDRIRHIESLSMALCSEYMLAEVNDGGILVFERIDETTMQDNAKTFLDEKYNKIDVEIQQNDDTSQFPCAIIDTEQPMSGQVMLNWSALRLSQYVGEMIGWDPQRILLWRLSPYAEKPTHLVVEAQLKMLSFRVRELLCLSGDHAHDPRKNRKYKVFYNKLPIPISEMEKRRQMRITIMDDKFNITEATIFPEKNGTVASILEEAKRIFKFAPNGTGQLRLLYVGNNSHSKRVYNIFNIEEQVQTIYQKILSPNVYTVRVEEIPHDQLQINPNEFLLPVCHYDKSITEKMFGVPFYFKITDGETLRNIGQRLRERLDVPEKEFEKYKFVLMGGARSSQPRPVDMDSDEKIKLAELFGRTATNAAVAPSPSTVFLAIDHYNRAPKQRGSHAEKAIVIHN